MKRVGFSRLRPAGWLLVLHVAASVRYAWDPMSLFSSLLRINPDLLLLLALGSLGALVWGRRAATDHLLTVMLLFVPVYRFGYSIVPAFYGKEFDPYNDVLMLPGLVHLLTHDLAETPRFWILMLASAGLGLVALLCYVVVFRAWRCGMRRIAADRRLAWRTSALGCGVFAVAAWLRQPLAPLAFVGCFYWPLNDSMFERSAAYVAELWAEERWRIEEQFLAREAAAQQQLTDLPRNVDGLDGADVYLLILESYGRALFDSEQSTEAFGEWSTRLTRQVDDAGFAIVSRFMAPSIRGGQSSLAHAELLTGIKVENRRIFDRLLISDLVPLPRIFANSGYHTVNAQPAMDAVWPASRQFFGFTEDRFNDSLPYDGPWFPWGYMPDQYALQLLLETEVRVAEEPLFLQYVGVTSHAPYTRTPRYYPVWADTQGPDAYDNTDAAVFDIDWLNFRGHPDVGTAYLSTLGYSLQTAIGFLGELERPSLVIVIGDHQPPSAGGLMRDTPTMDVLCHVMSNAPMLMQPFRSRGFVDGFRPPDDAGSVSFSRFLSWFLVHFGRQ